MNAGGGCNAASVVFALLLRFGSIDQVLCAFQIREDHVVLEERAALICHPIACLLGARMNLFSF